MKIIYNFISKKIKRFIRSSQYMCSCRQTASVFFAATRIMSIFKLVKLNRFNYLYYTYSYNYNWSFVINSWILNYVIHVSSYISMYMNMTLMFLSIRCRKWQNFDLTTLIQWLPLFVITSKLDSNQIIR